MLISQYSAEEIKSLVSSILDDDGKEINNPKPMESTIKFGKKHLSLEQRIARILHKVSKEAELQGQETEEEANDFDIEDEDPDPITSYEVEAMIDEVPASVQEKMEIPTETEKETEPTADPPPADPPPAGDVEAE